MADEQKAKLRLEIAHVLFMDIVGYSKLLTDEQSEALQELNQIVRKTEAAREAEAAGELTILPTGDGMALVFTGSVEEPVECALEISHALRAQPSLPIRMGIHSGPVHHVKDANERENIAGVGINIAQRVMDCGDAGHILVSKRVADDLAQKRRWQPYLHELGDVEVKHGVVVSLVNLYAETIGNPAPPTRIGKVRGSIPGSRVGTRKATLSPRPSDLHCRGITPRACHRVGDFRARDHAHARPTPVSDTTSTEPHRRLLLSPIPLKARSPRKSPMSCITLFLVRKMPRLSHLLPVRRSRKKASPCCRS